MKSWAGAVLKLAVLLAVITNMTTHSEWAALVLRLGAINLVLLLFRLIKQCKLHPRLAFITDTLNEALNQLLPFSILFVCFM